MAKVAVTRVEFYDAAVIRESLERLLTEIGQGDFVRPGERILVKPNLLAGFPPERAVTTHPAVVEAVLGAVIDRGAIPIVGDSPGGVLRGTKTVYAKTGIADVAEKMGAEIIPPEAKGARKIPLPDGETLHISKIVDEVDGIVDLAKLKTHSLELMTLTVKNLYGLVPGFRKAEYHKIYPTPYRFAELVVELYSHTVPKARLAVVDGIVGMDGNGPSAGRPRKLGIFALSDSASALDDFLENFVGLKKHSPIVNVLRKRGLIPDYEVKTLPPAPERPRNFKIPSNLRWYFLPAWFTRVAGRLVQVKPGVDEAKCIKCGECFKSCPVGAISIEMGRTPPKFDYSKCIRCYCCHEICPVGAIVFKKSPLSRLVG